MKLKYIFILLISVAFTACKSISWSSTTYEVLTPAYYTLPSDFDTVVIANCINTPLAAEKNQVYRTLTDSTLDQKYIAALPSDICNIVADEINESKYMNMCSEDTVWNFEQLVGKCDSVCIANRAKAIFALTYADIAYKSRTESNNMILTSVLKSQFSIIYPNGNIEQLETETDTLSMKITVSEDGVPQIPLYDQRYYPIAEYSGMSFTSKLIPSWDKGYRQIFYITSSMPLSDVLRYVFDDEWDKARDAWLQIYAGRSELEKFCAAFNLGVYNDMIDNAYEASRWYSAALDIIETHKKRQKYAVEEKLAIQYFREAVDRMNELEILDEQMN